MEAYDATPKNLKECRKGEEEEEKKNNTTPTDAKQQSSNEKPMCLRLKAALRTNIAKPSDEVAFGEWESMTQPESKQSRPISARFRELNEQARANDIANENNSIDSEEDGQKRTTEIQPSLNRFSRLLFLSHSLDS